MLAMEMLALYGGLGTMNQENSYYSSKSEPPYKTSIAGITRRECVAALGAAATFSVCDLAITAQAGPGVGLVSLNLRINRKPHTLTVDPRTTLLDLLRERLALTGTKKGCDHGQCGACTVLVNRRRINSCLSLAVTHNGDEVTTIEGLAEGAALHPIQSAFIEQDGFQCGYCTSGQICSAVAVLEEARRGEASLVTADLKREGPVELTDAEIRERMSGNICRCGAYPGIVAAVKEAASIQHASRRKESAR
jgi:xanthine dehydrogenase YagT iron-sulfur-binding subunit